jgi:outer membrane protein OmpA-like peptidoglycan-associated protein
MAFGTAYPNVMPGTTTITISNTSFNELKSTGKIDFKALEIYGAPGGLREHWQEGELTRVQSGDESYPIIVNDQPTNLPVIHAKGSVQTIDKTALQFSKRPIDQPLATDLYVLDDPLNPLVLLFKMDINNYRVQIIKIAYPVDQPAKNIENELAKNKRAVIYGIYFDFASDVIKPESEPILREIAGALKDNPDWKLTVEGHTDNIGGDAYNLELSKRRAAAVKQALIDRYHIAPDQLLQPNGFGASQPVAPNNTLEGRARNRRVELVRQ